MFSRVSVSMESVAVHHYRSGKRDGVSVGEEATLEKSLLFFIVDLCMLHELHLIHLIMQL